MGQYVSKIKGHYVTRSIQRFNIESRTDKILQSEKPKAAPRYPSDEKIRQELQRDLQEQINNELHSKSSEHDSRLKDVYVRSHDPQPESRFDPDINRRRPENPDRPLPRARTIRGIDRSGFAVDESRNIKKGKISLEKVQEMVATYKSDPEKHTPTILAQYYALDLAHTEAVLEHFRIYGQVKVKTMTAKEKQDRQNPYMAQPDYVEAAGEHPPLISPENIPRVGMFPKMNVTPKPFILKQENKMEIAPGSESTDEQLASGNEQIKLNKSEKDIKK